MKSPSIEKIYRGEEIKTESKPDNFGRLFSLIENFQLYPEDDDGVPPGCRHQICPFDHRNPFFNDNNHTKKIGLFGLQLFDKYRKFLMGCVSLFTILAMFLTIWGCCALSTARSAVRNTYWAGGTSFNSTSGKHLSIYIGLRSLEYVECPFKKFDQHYSNACQEHTIQFWDSSCKSGPVSGACNACAGVAITMWTTAFCNCAGMILALLGTQTRMRKVADVPVQKMLGMWSDAFTAVSLSVALFTFQDKCFANLHLAFQVEGMNSKFWIGTLLNVYFVLNAF